MKWEDATGYSQRDPYPRVARSWRLRITRDVTVTVISEHIYHKGEWVMNCDPWFTLKPLGLKVDDNAAAAKVAALKMVTEKISELAAAAAKLEAE